MGFIGNVVKVIGTVGVGAVAGTAKLISVAEERFGFIPEDETKLVRQCVNTIKKMWGREVDEQPETIYDQIYHEEACVNNLSIMLENNRNKREMAAAEGNQEKVYNLDQTISDMIDEILEHKKRAIGLTLEADPDADVSMLEIQLRRLERELKNPDNTY